MKKKLSNILILILVIFLFSFQNIDAQNIDKVNFSFTKHNNTEIYFLRTKKNTIHVTVKSKNVESKFYIENVEFEKLTDALKKLDKIDPNKAYIIGLDGSNCTIEYGAKGKYTVYKYWTPESKTESRGLRDFLDVSELILKIAKLNPDDILYK